MADRLSREYVERYHSRMPVLRAVRLKCSECMGAEPLTLALGGAATAIEECSSVNCALWPFRMGSNPWRAEASAAQVEAARRNISASPKTSARTRQKTREDESAGVVVPETAPLASDEPAYRSEGAA